MSAITDNATGSDPNSSWLGFDSLKDAIQTAVGAYTSVAAANTAATGNNLPTNSDPVQGAQTGSANAATLQPNLASFTGILSNQYVIGGAVLLGLLYVAHKVMK